MQTMVDAKKLKERIQRAAAKLKQRAAAGPSRCNTCAGSVLVTLRRIIDDLAVEVPDVPDRLGELRE